MFKREVLVGSIAANLLFVLLLCLGFSINCTKKATTAVVVPGEPTLVSPTNGAIGQATSLTMAWDAVNDAVSYSIKVSSVATFATTVSNQTGITEETAVVSGLADSTTYYWEVRATNAGGAGAWSGVWKFTTLASNLPDSVSIFLPPADVDTLTHLGMTINTGTTPPNIVGDYYVSDPILANSNIPNDYVGQSFTPWTQQFYNQTADLHISEQYIEGGETAQGVGVFITGSGNNFTVYVPETGMETNGYDSVPFKSAALFSGTLTSTGIYNYQEGLILTWKGPDPDSIVIEVGQSRVIVQADSLAIKVDTFPYYGKALVAKSSTIAATMSSFLRRKK